MRSLVVLSLTAVLAAGLPATVTQAEEDHPGLQIVSLDGDQITGRQFAMVALRGTEDLPDNVEIQVQRPDGEWGPWQPLETDHAIDNKTEPLWVGDSTGLRVRGADQPGLSVALVDPGPEDGMRREMPVHTKEPVVISRAGWGADESVREACFARQGIGVEYATTIKAATIHHTAGTNDYTPGDSARIARGVYLFHAIDRDWCDIGYNFLVDKYGQVFEGRIGGLEYPVIGAHAGGFNRFTFGVSMMGTYSTVAPSDAQLNAVAAVVAWKLAGNYRLFNGSTTLISAGGGTSKYPAGTAVTLPTIFAHRDVGNTDCPGTVAYNAMPTLRQKVGNRTGFWRGGPIWHKWTEAGGEAGPLGSPYRVESKTGRDGRYTTFANNTKSIYWSAATGAAIIGGAIRDKWGQLRFEMGALGFPVTDELTTADNVGRYNNFELGNGSIYWSEATGAHAVLGSIKQHWANLGAEQSYLGYPTSDQYETTGGLRSDFQNGYVFYNTATGETSDHRNS
ncbi:N-acetylmuramoyl-L-alanine amidase [Kibdelosporangium aridum]|uniref:N-acetylmuramoyl-L-alanine amidase n=1 Tax=Kibdelosporangium aridum TaxID=2030 RepID=UPI00068A22D8